MRIRMFFSLLLLSLSGVTLSQTPASKSPPMGWNSWDPYGLTITEAQFRDNVVVLRDKLLPFGWRYAVIDEGWFFENPQDRDKPDTLHYALDGNGRYVPTPLRFPSAKPLKAEPPPRAKDDKWTLAATIESTSFAELSRWVHAQGLMFGIHIVRGVPRASVERELPIENTSFHTQDAADKTDACPWDPTNWGVKDNAAGQAWYDSLIRQYAAWGVDLLKVDCISDHPYKVGEIRMIRRAIDKAGRPMVLSLSPGPTAVAHAGEVSKLATMWRISDDFWDTWAETKPGQTFPQPLKGQFDRLAAWSSLDLPEGTWADADMLPFGELRPSPGWGKPRHTRLTEDEQRTVMTLWAMNRSPLILGANLTLLDDATLKLLTNRDLLKLDQTPGMTGGQVQPNELNPPLPPAEKQLRIWAASVVSGKAGREDRTAFAAIFNLGDAPITIDKPISDLNLTRAVEHARGVTLYDVWAGRSLGRVARVHATIPAHGVVLLERQ